MPNFTDWQVLVGLILLISFLTETIIEIVKTQFQAYFQDKTIQALSMIIGIALAWLLHASLFDTTNIALQIAGYIVIGLVASRGANYAHNWLDKLPRG